MNSSEIKTNETINTDNLETLSSQLDVLNKEFKKAKNKKQKKELSEQINVLKKKINSIIKSQSKLKSKKFYHKPKPIKKFEVVSFQMEKKEFQSSLIKMMRPYSTTKRRIIYPMIIALGLLSAISTLFLVQNTGLFSMGVTGVLQGIAKITKASI